MKVVIAGGVEPAGQTVYLCYHKTGAARLSAPVKILRVYPRCLSQWKSVTTFEFPTGDAGVNQSIYPAPTAPAVYVHTKPSDPEMPVLVIIITVSALVPKTGCYSVFDM